MKDLETRIAILSEISTESAFEILTLFDEVERVLRELGKRGTNLSTELSQRETLTATFYKKRSLFIRRIGGVRAILEVREKYKPPEDAWWWFVDKSLVLDRRKK